MKKCNLFFCLVLSFGLIYADDNNSAEIPSYCKKLADFARKTYLNQDLLGPDFKSGSFDDYQFIPGLEIGSELKERDNFCYCTCVKESLAKNSTTDAEKFCSNLKNQCKAGYKPVLKCTKIDQRCLNFLNKADGDKAIGVPVGYALGVGTVTLEVVKKS